jgi:hypothetical protein
MATTQEGSWRDQARTAIKKLLDEFPGVLNRDRARLVLRKANPHSTRSLRAMWTQESMKALRQRFWKQETPLRMHVYPFGVWCDWCESLHKACVACATIKRDHRKDPRAVAMLRTFTDQIYSGENLGPILGDWLEENGAEDLAIRVRDAVKRHPRNLKKQAAAVVAIVGRYVSVPF